MNPNTFSRVFFRGLVLPITLLFRPDPAVAQTWTPSSAPTTNWVSVASSTDGTKLAALVADGAAVYTSTNAGTAWILTRPPSGLAAGSSITSSADGRVLVVASTRDASGQFAGNIFGSTNSGETWFTAGAGFKTWTGVASSADGVRLVGVSAYRRSFGGGIATSADYGVTWSFASAPSVNVFYQGVGSSADGNKLMVLNGTIISSPDGGATWGTTTAPGSGWVSITSSADGTHWVAVSDATSSGVGGPIYLSTDSGTTWAPTSAPVTNWSFVACSAHASTLVAASGGVSSKGWIYTSRDGGATWSGTQAPFAHWTSVACSADGTRMVATDYGGRIYTLALNAAAPAPVILPLALTTAGDVLISWTALSNITYRVQYKPDLNLPGWTDLPGDVLANASTAAKTDILAATNRYYRIQVLP